MASKEHEIAGSPLRSLTNRFVTREKRGVRPTERAALLSRSAIARIRRSVVAKNRGDSWWRADALEDCYDPVTKQGLPDQCIGELMIWLELDVAPDTSHEFEVVLE